MGDRCVKHIRRLSLESRHAVEEGVEFGVDIDLVDVAPYFKFNLRCADVLDEPLRAIFTALAIDMDRALATMQLQSSASLSFAVQDMSKLGAIFLDWMQR